MSETKPGTAAGHGSDRHLGDIEFVPVSKEGGTRLEDVGGNSPSPLPAESMRQGTLRTIACTLLLAVAAAPAMAQDQEPVDLPRNLHDSPNIQESADRVLGLSLWTGFALGLVVSDIVKGSI